MIYPNYLIKFKLVTSCLQHWHLAIQNNILFYLQFIFWDISKSYYFSPSSTTMNMSYSVLLGFPRLQPVFSFLFIIAISISKLASFLSLIRSQLVGLQALCNQGQDSRLDKEVLFMPNKFTFQVANEWGICCQVFLE